MQSSLQHVWSKRVQKTHFSHNAVPAVPQRTKHNEAVLRERTKHDENNIQLMFTCCEMNDTLLLVTNLV